MRAQVAVVLIVLVVLAGFGALNWSALSTPAPLNFLVVRVEAPPGLVMLAVAATLRAPADGRVLFIPPRALSGPYTAAVMARRPSRQAASRPSRSSVRLKVGTKAAVIAPSANRSRTRLGRRNATLKASIWWLAPNACASTCSRTSPRTRLAIVALPARPAARVREGPGGVTATSSHAGTSGPGLCGAKDLRHMTYQR